MATDIPQQKIVFTDNELRHIALNAMGRASEAGSEPVYKLGLAANIVGGKPNNNSGYTLGYMQVDFGAHPGKTNSLVTAYNVWAEENGKNIITDTNQANYLLSQNNSRIDIHNKNPTNKNDQRSYQNVLTMDLGKNLNEFLATDAGHDYVLGLQESAYKDIETNMKAALAKPCVQNMTREQAVLVLGTVGKISNQAGPGFKKRDGTLTYTGQIFDAFSDDMTYKAFQDNAIAVTNKQGYLKAGYEHTETGTKLYNSLAADQSTLGNIFREQLEKDPYAITGQEFKESPQEQLMDTMFRYPDKATQLIDALDNDKNIAINPTTWRKSALEDLKNEVYTVGVKDGTLFSIDREGNAHRMDDKGQWIAFDNDKNPLVHHDVKGQWTTTPRDLAQNHTGPEVLEMQQKLNALNGADNQLTINEKNPLYDQATTDQVKAFQEANKDTLGENGVTGKLDSATRALMDQQLNEQNKHLPFVRSNDALSKTEREISTKLDEIDKLNGQLKDYDPIRDIGEIAKAEADIRADQNTIAQLELNKADYINAEQAKLMPGKAGHEATVQNCDTALEALKAQALITSSNVSGAPTLQTALEAQKTDATQALADISEKYNALEARKPSMIEQKIAENEIKIAEQQRALKGYDEQKDGADNKTAIKNGIKTLQLENSQLQSEQQMLLTNQIALQEQAKKAITHKIEGVDRQINTIETAQKLVNGPSLDTENSLYSQMKGCVADGDRLLLTNAEQALADKGSIDPTNKADVKVLQAVFHERGLLEAKEVAGIFGPKTQEHLAQSLGLDKSTSFNKKIVLDQETLTKVAEKPLEALSAKELSDKLEAKKKPLVVERDTHKEGSDKIDQSINMLKDKSAEPAIALIKEGIELFKEEAYKGGNMILKMAKAIGNPEAQTALAQEIRESEVGQKFLAGVEALRESRQLGQQQREQAFEAQQRAQEQQTKQVKGSSIGR